MITRALSEMARVARNGAILNEWHLFDGGGRKTLLQHSAHWVYDYAALLKGVPGVKAVRVERLPPGLWVDQRGRGGAHWLRWNCEMGIA